MQQFSNQEISELKSRINQIQEMLASNAGVQSIAAPQQNRIDRINDRVDGSDAALAEQIIFNIQMRRARKAHFGSDQLSGPAWDMMLDLMLAKSNSRELSASDLATGAGVPLSSGLRMIAMLEKLELTQRSIDARDRRRTIVRLTEKGSAGMASYFAQLNNAWEDRHRRAM